MLEGVHRETGEVKQRPFEQHCGVWRACDRCLGRRKNKLSRDVNAQRETALAERAWQTSERYTGSEGRWSERLITLTVPHGESAAEDAALVRKAWRELSRRLLAHLKGDRGVVFPKMAAGIKAHVPYVRALEIAPGATGGHAHLHLWWMGPFVDHAWLRVTFGRILERMGATVPQKAWNEVFHRPPSSNPRMDARWGPRRKDGTGWHGAIDARAPRWCMTRRGEHGRASDSVSWPVVDIRSARDVGAAEYAGKVGVHLYTVKGNKGAVSRLHPVHAATVYQALEGARATQWARGWAPQKAETEWVWRLRFMSPAERRDWALAGRKAWNDVERAAEPLQSVPIREAHAPPPVELQVPLPF